MEYIGDDFDANMANMTEDPKTREWWAIMEPMQQPVENRKEGEWWGILFPQWRGDFVSAPPKSLNMLSLRGFRLCRNIK